MPTWDSAPADDLWTEACGKDRWLGATETLGQDIRKVSDAMLWQFRVAASKSLVEYARERLSLELAAAGAVQPSAPGERAPLAYEAVPPDYYGPPPAYIVEPAPVYGPYYRPVVPYYYGPRPYAYWGPSVCAGGFGRHFGGRICF